MQEPTYSSALPDDGAETSPSPAAVGEVTQLLIHWNGANAADQERLLKLIYPELKRVAEHRMRRERSDHTLQATALVNEFFIRLSAVSQQTWQNRAHFLAVASRAMHRILVDYARSHATEKRSGQMRKVELDEAKLAAPREIQDILEVHELLEKLAALDKRMADVVELRYFGGLSFGEVAEALGVGERTAERDWQVARAWLYARIQQGKGDAG